MPVITGTAPVDTEAEIQQDIAAKWGASAGEAYVAYYTSHPSLTPYEAGKEFTEIILVKGLDTALAAGLGTAGSVTGGVPAAAAKGAADAVNSLSPDQWLNKLGSLLTSRGTWIRIAEGVLGVALILVAVAEIGKGTAIGKAVKKVPFI